MKISFLGAGQVGGQCAFLAASNGLADVYLYDNKPGLAKGKALDIGQSLIFSKYPVTIDGSEDIQYTADSDVLVITAGASRKTGMTREDLLSINAETVYTVLLNALKYSPGAIVIVVTNPINTITYLATKVAGLPTKKIVGMAGLLDNSRFSYFIANEIGCDHRDVKSWVIGDHGDHLVPVISHTTISDIPITQCLSQKQIADVCRRTRSAGTQIVNYLQQGSAFYAPGMAVTRMLKSIIHESDEAIPCSVYLNGEYGVNGLVAGVPVKLSKCGVEEIIEMDISEDESRSFKGAIGFIRETNRSMLRLMPSMMSEVL